MRRVAHRDGRAFEELLARYADRIHGFLTHSLRDAVLADDVAQETFVRMYERASSYDPAHAFAVWLFRIARNLAIDQLRRRGAQERGMAAAGRAAAGSAVASPHASLEGKELAEQFAAALGSIPEAFRTAFVLREVEGMSYEEIAAVTETHPKTVSTRLCRAREQLRELLAAYLGPGVRRAEEAL